MIVYGDLGMVELVFDFTQLVLQLKVVLLLLLILLPENLLCLTGAHLWLVGTGGWRSVLFIAIIIVPCVIIFFLVVILRGIQKLLI